MPEKKKIVAIHTDSPISKTGLGRNGRALAKYLLSTNKYDIRYFCTGFPWSAHELQKLPFKAQGCLPDNQNELMVLQNDPGKLRDASYGALLIDKFVKENRPDVMIFSNDSWSFNNYDKKAWWNKFHCVPHITLDSLPFLKDQIEFIKNSKIFTVWAKFAQEEAARIGFKDVKTIPAIIEHEYFRPLNDSKKNELRKKFNIPLDTFVVGFVFRSQLRKEVKPLLEGFAEFKRNNPEAKNAKLLLHTNFAEGWDIPKLIEDLGINKNDILTTYFCRECGEYEIKSFVGQDQDCKYCGAIKSQITCNVAQGVSEEKLNEVYNLMDAYCHLANAGGCEMPIIEALYAGLPIATVNYSFGKTFTDESFCYTIESAKTIQFQTQFDRAAPYASSVAKFMRRIFNLDKSARKKLGEQGREFALKTFSPEIVGKQWEQLIDALSEVTYDYNFDYVKKNPSYPFPEISDVNEFLTTLYDNILKQPEPINGDGRKYWLETISKGVSRADVYKYFVKVAMDDNNKNLGIKLEDFFDGEVDNRILFAIPEDETAVLHTLSLLKSCKETYPECDIYVATHPEFKNLLNGNPYIYKHLNFMPEFENFILMEGGANKGYVKYLFLPHVNAQKFPNFIHNNSDKSIYPTISV